MHSPFGIWFTESKIRLKQVLVKNVNTFTHLRREPHTHTHTHKNMST